MATWKVLLTAFLGCVCLALAFATLIIPLEQKGNQYWAWLAGLVGATLAAGTVFTLFLRHAGGSLDMKRR